MFVAQHLYTLFTTNLTWKLLHNITHFVKKLKIIFMSTLSYKVYTNIVQQTLLYIYVAKVSDTTP
jgi:hypothetical protein